MSEWSAVIKNHTEWVIWLTRTEGELWREKGRERSQGVEAVRAPCLFFYTQRKKKCSFLLLFFCCLYILLLNHKERSNCVNLWLNQLYIFGGLWSLTPHKNIITKCQIRKYWRASSAASAPSFDDSRGLPNSALCQTHLPNLLLPIFAHNITY